jgi:phosphoribosyl 1,2-cyclic phosphodiesterase
MESPFFPINLHEVPANVRIEELKEKNFNLGPVQVQAFAVYHPGICMGYRLSHQGRSVAFFPDNEMRHGSGNNSPAGNSSWASVKESNRQLCEFLRDTDVVVMDSQYDRQEYADHVGWGHGCLDDVVMLALEANVRHLYLFHHDPDHDDAKVSEMVVDARRLVSAQKGSLAVDAAREGLTLELKADVEALKVQKV